MTILRRYTWPFILKNIGKCICRYTYNLGGRYILCYSLGDGASVTKSIPIHKPKKEYIKEENIHGICFYTTCITWLTKIQEFLLWLIPNKKVGVWGHLGRAYYHPSAPTSKRSQPRYCPCHVEDLEVYHLKGSTISTRRKWSHTEGARERCADDWLYQSRAQYRLGSCRYSAALSSVRIW